MKDAERTEISIDQTVSFYESNVRLESCKMNINYEFDSWCLPLQTNKVLTLLNLRIELVHCLLLLKVRKNNKNVIRFRIHIEFESGDISTWIFLFLIKRIIWYALAITRATVIKNKCKNDEIMNSFQELKFISISVQVFMKKGILMSCGKNNGKG